MGIPKFFRYLSERYPLTSQLITSSHLPEFDNLYLDFNGIIHNCSHSNSSTPGASKTEEAIITSIFAYLDFIVQKVQPKELLFLAVDGVAPRAKMNQQRGRRFRTAQEAQQAREKALRAGEVIKEKGFDSNCITPGTPFMTRLTAHLKYFISSKLSPSSPSYSPLYAGLTIIFSDQGVPGEGEHKIMEYIRYIKAQPDYTHKRHCLYGLDADLIILGLGAHEPYFCLLREEVKFGGAKSGGEWKDKGDTQNFYLLHLGLLREYINLEFSNALAIETLPFPYDLERILDDIILLSLFVGNDFLPHLPSLHIHANGLDKIWSCYVTVLPKLGGYLLGGDGSLAEKGRIDFRRLGMLVDEMSREWEEKEVFPAEVEDLSWLGGKRRGGHASTAQQKPRKGLTKSQRALFESIESFVLGSLPNAAEQESTEEAKPTTTRSRMEIVNTLPARDRAFLSLLCRELNLDVAWDGYAEDEETNLIVISLPSPQRGDDDSDDDDENWEDTSSDDDEAESREAIQRVLSRYAALPTLPDDQDSFEQREEDRMRERFESWKDGYYKEKLGFSIHDRDQMDRLVRKYCEGLQWVMHYYYTGVASWGWFYDYHYAPRISDLNDLASMHFEFELGRPFRPFEQLMGVLPVASMDNIPEAYKDLMYDPNSPILDFYPLEFEQDLNGKKADWEAVVKIPFTDEKRLLSAMASREHRLTSEEKLRNTWGVSTKFSYGGEAYTYPSSLPGFFPALSKCMAIAEPFDLPAIGDEVRPSNEPIESSSHDDVLAGFPSLKTLPHAGVVVVHHGVNVHGQESRNKTLVIHIRNPYEGSSAQQIAKEMIGKRTFFGWPFLKEGLVVAVSDEMFKYEKLAIVQGLPTKVISSPHSPNGLSLWKAKAERIEGVYSKKCGIVTGSVAILLHVRPLKGMKPLEDGSLVKDYHEDSTYETEVAIQMAINAVSSEDPRFVEKPPPPLSEEFPEGNRVFFLGEHAYGVAAQVAGLNEADDTLSVILAFFPADKGEISKYKLLVSQRIRDVYHPSFKAADILGMSGRALSRITSSFMVLSGRGEEKVNLGLSIKFEAKALKVIEYSRKEGRHWEFSEKAIELIKEYKANFPEIFRCLDGNSDAMARASDIFPGPDPDSRIREIKAWLKTKGVRDFEPVSLFCDQLGKETVSEIEQLADTLNATKTSSSIKKAIVKSIPRKAVLKPNHAQYRLQTQRFDLGDRVTMVQDTGTVPLGARGVVIGLNSKTMDVIWDTPFLSGTTLGDRCSEYRGLTVEFTSCLNLTNPQFVASTKAKEPSPPKGAFPAFKPRIGPYPTIQPANGQAPAGGFRPSGQQPSQPAFHIMTNPNRPPRGFANGHVQGSPSTHQSPRGRGYVNTSTSPPPTLNDTSQPSAQRGFIPRGRGVHPQGNFRGRGIGFASQGPTDIRGRGRGGFRGRGRGNTTTVPS